MTADDKTLEKKLLLKRVYPVIDIFRIGEEQAVPFFSQYVNAWECDPDDAALEAAQVLSDKQLQEVVAKHPPRSYAVFRGAYYNFENSTLTLRGVTEKIHAGIKETQKKYGTAVATILKVMVLAGGTFGAKELHEPEMQNVNPYAVLGEIRTTQNRRVNLSRRSLPRMANPRRDYAANPGRTRHVHPRKQICSSSFNLNSRGSIPSCTWLLAHSREA